MADLEERVSKLEEKFKKGEFELLRVSKAIAIFDEKAQPRILLSVDSSGDPFVTLTNTEGNSAIHIGTNEGSSDVAIRDSMGMLRIKLTVSEEANPIVVLCGANGEPQLSLSVLGNAPRVMLHDADGALRIASCLDPVPHVQIYGKDERPRINLSLSDEVAEVCTVDKFGERTGGL